MAFTFFFRDLQMLELAIDHVAPEIAGRSRPKIWDAGCAMGPEAYTLAILLAGRMGQMAFRNLRIDATDLDETNQFGDIVRQGVYPHGDLERMPAGILEQYFEPAGDAGRAGAYRLAERIRASVRFQRHDLLSLREPDSGYSLVVCKNVLLHFSLAQRVEVIAMFHRALGPGGYLVNEHTQKLPEEAAHLFEQVVPHGQLFRKLEVAVCA
jgi:chemotaxis protein methyltransferase CheR